MEEEAHEYHRQTQEGFKSKTDTNHIQEVKKLEYFVPDLLYHVLC